MKKEQYMMQDIRKIRNACAHSNCILNDLQSTTNPRGSENTDLSNALSQIGISRDVRRRKMSNVRIRQIVTLLYFSHIFVTSNGVKRRQAEQLHEITDSRMLKNADYYVHSDQYLSFCKLLKVIVDNWYPL